ncbi:phage minor head protein [Petroclostridium sp. X23]|uniref:phage minor head protein n=1 Tax=Petroclostridium sp. X23 TaxID=3045146 RepID=UPI0024ADF28F|nr:phage minor head protein [Petroclostridium sp. X23]WHH58299.1 phage minor head protein [Petroclostridium sp. X23]
MPCKHAHQPVHLFKINSNQPYSQAGAIALQKLRDYLKAVEPKMVRWLYDTWNAEAKAIKYQELRDAIIAGSLSLTYLKQWQQDYAYIVNTKLAPAWLEAMGAAANQLKEKYPEWVFDPNWPAVQKWVQEHGSDLVVNLTQTQHDALRQVINRAAFMGDFGPDELSRAIRPLVGMAPREAMAVLKYYESLRNNGMAIKQAQHQVANYAGRVHRHRAMRIARTELCFAYNRGIDEGIKQAQAQGYIGQVQKRWMTADDERVCEICGPLDGQVVSQDVEFYILLPQKITGHHRLPPAHPHCRCTVIYEEI